MTYTPYDLLSQILQGSAEHTQWLTALKNAQIAEAQKRQAALGTRMNQYTANAPAGRPGATAPNDAFGMFMKAIAQQESGGNYGALGSMVGGDRAYGKYQVMGANIPSWTQNALGTSMTPQEFLADKAAQDAVAKKYLWGLFKNYGPKKAGMAWNQGVAGMQQGWGQSYGHDIMGRMRDYGYTHGMPAAPNTPGAINTGHGWILPVTGYNITDPYGPRTNPVSGQNSVHEGVDLAVAMGTPVQAARGGTVINAGWDPIYGNQFEVRGPGGTITQYGHLNNINPRWQVGDTINQGQRVGKVGSTGWSTGPHLHFGVQKQGEWVNPMQFLQGASSQPSNGPTHPPVGNPATGAPVPSNWQSGSTIPGQSAQSFADILHRLGL